MKLVMHIFKKTSFYSLTEKLEIFIYSIGYFLIKWTPKELKDCYRLTSELLSNGIALQRNKINIKFSYKINDAFYNFELKNNSSDPQVFQQIIIGEEYKNILKLMRINNISCNLMIDAGANIGLTTIYFKSFFPNLNIIAIEPSIESFARLERNIKINNIKNVTLLNKGIWSHTTRLKGDYSFRDGQDWSFRLVDALTNENALFEVFSIPDLIFSHKIKYIDFLKMDIEGGENEVFKKEADLGWLKYVKLIAIEIHDEFTSRDAIEHILINNQFDLSFSGELTIGVNRNSQI